MALPGSTWALAVGCALLQTEDLAPPTATGAVALSGSRVDVLPAPNRFGTAGGWLEERCPIRFQVTSHGDDIEVVASNIDPGFHHEYVRILLGPSGGRGEAYFGMDVAHATLLDLGGVAVLLTDGKDSCVEFEVTCSSGLHGVAPYFGRVRLGEVGVELATHLTERAKPPEYERFCERRTNEVRTDEGMVSCSGHVDCHGRRQGLWTLLDAASRKRLESTWMDGRASGPLLQWDEKGRLRNFETLEDGLTDGIRYGWYEGGELRSLDEFVGGTAHGQRVVFHPDGTKQIEMRWENGAQVGSIQRWDAQGSRTEDASRGTIVSPEPRRRFLEELRSFHTRRD